MLPRNKLATIKKKLLKRLNCNYFLQCLKIESVDFFRVNFFVSFQVEF